jgi:hypothetical protein
VPVDKKWTIIWGCGVCHARHEAVPFEKGDLNSGCRDSIGLDWLVALRVRFLWLENFLLYRNNIYDSEAEPHGKINPGRCCAAVVFFVSATGGYSFGPSDRAVTDLRQKAPERQARVSVLQIHSTPPPPRCHSSLPHCPIFGVFDRSSQLALSLPSTADSICF